MMLETAQSISASANTITDALPPSSKVHFLTVSAAWRSKLLPHQNSIRRRRRWNGLSVHTFCFLSEPFHKARAVGDFPIGFRQRLTLFSRKDTRQIVAVLDYEVEPFLEYLTPLFGAAPRPVRQRLLRSSNGLAGFVCPQVGHTSQNSSIGRIGDVKGFPRLSRRPGTCNVGLGIVTIKEVIRSTRAPDRGQTPLQ
jgi:hypothetical protein